MCLLSSATRMAATSALIIVRISTWLDAFMEVVVEVGECMALLLVGADLF